MPTPQIMVTQVEHSHSHKTQKKKAGKSSRLNGEGHLHSKPGGLSLLKKLRSDDRNEGHDLRHQIRMRSTQLKKYDLENRNEEVEEDGLGLSKMSIPEDINETSLRASGDLSELSGMSPYKLKGDRRVQNLGKAMESMNNLTTLREDQENE